MFSIQICLSFRRCINTYKEETILHFLTSQTKPRNARLLHNSFIHWFHKNALMPSSDITNEKKKFLFKKRVFLFIYFFQHTILKLFCFCHECSSTNHLHVFFVCCCCMKENEHKESSSLKCCSFIVRIFFQFVNFCSVLGVCG